MLPDLRLFTQSETEFMYCTGAQNGAVYSMHRWAILAFPSNLTAPVQYYILIGHVLLSRLLELPKISLEGHLPGSEYHTAFSYAALVLHQHFKWHGRIKKKLGVTPESWQDPHEGIQDCNHTYSTTVTQQFLMCLHQCWYRIFAGDCFVAVIVGMFSKSLGPMVYHPRLCCFALRHQTMERLNPSRSLSLTLPFHFIRHTWQYIMEI